MCVCVRVHAYAQHSRDQAWSQVALPIEPYHQPNVQKRLILFVVCLAISPALCQKILMWMYHVNSRMLSTKLLTWKKKKINQNKTVKYSRSRHTHGLKDNRLSLGQLGEMEYKLRSAENDCVFITFSQWDKIVAMARERSCSQYRCAKIFGRKCCQTYLFSKDWEGKTVSLHTAQVLRDRGMDPDTE